jgi:hypothetical protein
MCRMRDIIGGVCHVSKAPETGRRFTTIYE